MTSLESLLAVRLVNLRSTAEGWQAQCPVCLAEGHDKNGKNHLHIWRSGAFHCVVTPPAGEDEVAKAHNRAIRAFIYAGADEATLLQLAVAIVDPEPKLNVDPVYPEELVAKLVPDHRYWLNRGVSEEVLRMLEGGLYPTDMRGQMEQRYCFPVRHHQNRRIMGWTGRLVTDASFRPKWKHLVKTNRCVYPLTAAAPHIKAARRVVLYESSGDYMKCATHGMPYGLVLLGLNLNSLMLGYLISANVDRVVISTNNDAIGDAKSKSVGNGAAERLRTKLVPYLGEGKVVVRFPQTAKDWGDATVEEINAFRTEVES